MRELGTVCALHLARSILLLTDDHRRILAPHTGAENEM